MKKLLPLFLLFLTACGENAPAAKPPPAPLTDRAVGYFCQMTLLEHKGPKGQIFLKGTATPLWFSTVRDLFAYTMMPEEVQEIAVAYVHDMGRARHWETPDNDAWIASDVAHYVIESREKGAMDQVEVIPFGEAGQARAFAREHGGRVVGFAGVPREYIFHGDLVSNCADYRCFISQISQARTGCCEIFK